jgi:predicted RNA-binding protein Jag
MTDQTGSEAPPQAKAPSPEKLGQATQVIGDILRLMGYPATLDVKDAADGGISVALHFQGEAAGVQPGRRSHLVDSLQFIVNKIINRPSTERRWISIGVGAHPEPRPPPGERPKKVPPPAPAPVAAPPPASAPAAAATPRRPAPAPPPPRAAPFAGSAPLSTSRRQEHDEASLQVSEDVALATAVRELARKSAELGRFYALAPMNMEDRARVLKAATGIAGLKVGVEGEGRNRRVVFTPDKPAPMPKRTVPDYGDEDDDA